MGHRVNLRISPQWRTPELCEPTRLLFLSLHDGHACNNHKLRSSLPDLQRRSSSPTSWRALVAIVFNLDLLLRAMHARYGSHHLPTRLHTHLHRRPPRLAHCRPG
ncbi:hypothetical protein GQ55_4G102500 [Panicum hallii var. hallii]|uniref:Uncharacterized protein n=1 Tax=Panicum hallii var. hallii TaxID=1504633 RepID=A0A2T7DX64_9POAL|nr:hypothetical protein GQ55_4G102500 [Panicum hallii var. hallii]